MHLTKRVRIQLTVFSVIAVTGGSVMAFGVLGLPSALLGIGRYEVTLQLPASGGLYPNGNVTYRGTEVGRVKDITVTPDGVAAILSLDSSVPIPADLTAAVHSQTAIGEQFVELSPRGDSGPTLRNGDVIAQDRTTLPPEINALLTATNNGLQAIPHDNLKTIVDEASTAVGGLGPELSRLVKGTTALTADARANLDSLTTVIDQTKPVLDAQIDTSDAIQAWATHLDDITTGLQTNDDALKGVLDKSPAAEEEARQLFNRLQPTVPILAANLASLSDVAVVYQPAIEQLLVLLPSATEAIQGSELANRDTKQAYKGEYFGFNLNINLPPACTTGYLPPNQTRSPSATDYPDRPAGDMYCRVPQDSALDVRGARNLPCLTRPGKRAPTVKMCESDENYVPLNDGYNWKGDGNATSSGQPVPQLPPGTPPPPAAPPALAVAGYDPATGSYVGPDGQRYTQANLAADAPQQHSWEDMLVPPKGN
jgi:phospholipid/cholesterol/gamma-HCH transport system substrate-binding protein